MDLGVKTKTTGQDDRSWQAVADYDDEMLGIQLDGSHFTTVFTDGVVPSGTPLSLLTASDAGKYGLYDNATAGGEAVFAGFLGRATSVKDRTGATVDPGAQLYDHGIVKEANLPAYWGTTIDGTARTSAKADNTRIQYR